MPVVARDSKNPSKLHATVNFPALMPSIAFSATCSVFIEPEDAAIMAVTSGLLFCSEKANKENQINSYHGLRLHDMNQMNSEYQSIKRLYFTLRETKISLL